MQYACSQSLPIPSTLSTIRQELSKLQPPRWTKQQQPKRVYKSEENNSSKISLCDSGAPPLVRYNAKQIKVLNGNFANNQNPTSYEFQRIANETGLDHYQVKKWFQNRRAKQRKRSQKQWHSRI